MRFRASFCDPFNPEIIELGEMSKEQIVSSFEQTPWVELLQQIEGKKINEVHYSPSLEIENIETRHGITLSVAGDPAEHEFYIFYKRPKTVSRFFGLSSKLEPNYLTEVHGQNYDEARACLQALLGGDYAMLEQRVK